jgi:hypothetical protein
VCVKFHVAAWGLDDIGLEPTTSTMSTWGRDWGKPCKLAKRSPHESQVTYGCTDVRRYDTHTRESAMITEARQYLESRKIVRREPLYSANRFARIVGDLPAAEVTFRHLNELRVQLAGKLSNRTIESTVADVLTVVGWVTGKAPAKGESLQIVAPDPQPVSIDNITDTWRHCSGYVRAFIAAGYWTALRQSDCMRWLQQEKQSASETIIIVASKTGKRHRIPYPSWLRAIVTAHPFPYRVTDFGRKSIRRDIANACRAAKLKVWTPKHLRQRGITEWWNASPSAGAIIHGSGMPRGIIKHYIDNTSLLESAAPRVRLPACFGASTSATSEESLLSNFRRLDPSAQSLITGTAERLAAG